MTSPPPPAPSATWSLGWISTAEPPTPVRLRLSRRKGFDLQALSLATNGLPAVKVTRPGKWGNPHVALPCWFHGPMPELGLGDFDAVTAADADREGRRIAVALYRLEAERRPQAFADLRGKNLACWCPLPSPENPDAPCHADVQLDLANRPVCEEVPPQGRDRGPAVVARPAGGQAGGRSAREAE